MNNSKQYRDRAAECMALAAAAENRRDRMALIHMAQAWLELAKQAEKNDRSDLWYETPPGRNDGKEVE